jgi:hypothetical protein
MVAKIVDPLRHLAVIQSMPAAAGWWWTAPVIVFLYLVLATWRSESTRAGIAMVVLMLAGYYVVYVTTPHPQSWHVETSFGRLLAQLWPTAVLAAVAGNDFGPELRVLHGDKLIESRLSRYGDAPLTASSLKK